MKDKLILKNGTEIELEAWSSLGALKVIAADRAAMVATWEQLTPENMNTVQVKDSDGVTRGNYTDLLLVSETSTVEADGTICTSYQLREKTALEKRMDAVEEGMEVHDSAIIDTASLAGELAEKVLGGTGA